MISKLHPLKMLEVLCFITVLSILSLHVECEVYTLTEDQRLPLTPLESVTFDRNSLLSCVLRCRMTESCRTINAGWDAASSLLTCELMGDGGALTLTSDPGWVFIEPEWVLAFRGTPNIEESVLDTWNQHGRHDNPYIMQSCTLLSSGSPLPCVSHIRTWVLDQWDDVEQVRLSVYKNNTVAAEVTFDGRGSNRTTWMDKARLLSSTWNDMTTNATTNFFAVEGYASTYRHFYMSRNHGGCSVDTGWFAVVDYANDIKSCTWETPGPFPTVLYSPFSTAVRSTQFERADFFMVHVRFTRN